MPAELRILRVDRLVLPERPMRSRRRTRQSLQASVAAMGVVVPPLVRAVGRGEYAVVAGAGRVEALREAKKGDATEVACIVLDADDREAALVALVENVVREGLAAMDLARALDVLVSEYGFAQAEVAERLGRAAGWVSDHLGVLDLDEHVVDALREERISFDQARSLLPLRASPSKQRRVLRRMLAEGFCGPALVALVRAVDGDDPSLEPKRFEVPDVGVVEAIPDRSGGMRVSIRALDRAALVRLLDATKKALE